MKQIETIDQYVQDFSPHVQAILQKIRKIVHDEAPQATEAISYGMPTFKMKGNLIHFAAFKHHIGVYPTPSGVAAFESQLKPYQKAKGSIQFQLDQPIPYDLIKQIVQYRVKEQQSTI